MSGLHRQAGKKLFNPQRGPLGSFQTNHPTPKLRHVGIMEGQTRAGILAENRMVLPFLTGGDLLSPGP